MTINLADNSPRVSYAVAQGVTQTSFTVSFEFFEDADLNVYVDGTLKTLTSDYTVTGGSGSTGSVAISVTGATGGSTVVITRAIDLERTSDFPSSGPFDIASLNTELDKFIAIAADLDDEATRGLHLKDQDEAVSTELPLKADRLGKVLAFNATTGVPEAGPTIADVSTLAAITADISTLADIEDGTDATDAIQTVAGISSNVSTVAGISGNVSTVAGISSDVTSVAGKASLITADFIADLNTLATADIVSDLNTLATSAIVTDMDALADLTTEIDALGDVTSDISTVSGISANVTTVAGISANVSTVAGISANVTTVAGDSADIATVAGISSAVSTVSSNNANVTSVAGNATNINAVAGNSTNINSVAGNSTNINTVAGAETNINTVASNISGVNSFAERYRVGSADPTTSLDEGDLAYNSTDNELKFYNGSAWQSITAGIANISEDTTPELGGDLSVAGNKITSASNGDIDIEPNGTGNVLLGNFEFDVDQSVGAGQDNHVLTYDNATGHISLEAVPAGGIASLADDSSPQLGGTLDANGNNIDLDGNQLILDADGDTKIVADTDDVISFDIGGVSNRFKVDGVRALHTNGIFGRDTTDLIQFNGTVCKIFLDGSERARFNTNGGLLLDSENGSNLLVDVRQGSAKHWVNIDIQGTNSTLDSYNHTSFSDNGTGNVTINFNNDMNNSGYSVSTASRAASDATPYVAASFMGNVRSTSQVKIQFAYGNASTTAFHDVPYSGNTTHGDLA